MQPVDEMRSSCPNCGGANVTRFCGLCGQDNRRDRLRLSAVCGDTIRNVLGAEAALWRTLRGLALAPGELASRYVGGQRRSYSHPVRFFAVAVAIWFLVVGVLDVDALRSLGVRIHGVGGGSRADRVAAFVRDVVANNLELVLLLAMPVRGMMLRRAFLSSERNAAECIVLVLFAAGFTYLASAALAPIALLDGRIYGAVSTLLGLFVLTRASVAFFGRDVWSCLVRVVLVTLLHSVVTMAALAALAVPWALLRIPD